MASSPVLKAISILRSLAATGRPVGVQQVASDVGLNVSTVHRLLQMLAKDGMAAYDAPSRTYTIGTECIRLATSVLGSHSLIGRVRPLLAELAQAVKETCAFTLYEPLTYSKIVALVERGPHALGYEFDVGSRDGIHAGASGKPILAFLPDDEIDRYLRRKLPKLTEFTVIEPASLRKEIVQIRKLGYATSKGERIPGAGVGIGAPVFSFNDRVIGSIVVTVPSFRWKPTRLSDIARKVKASAEAVSSIFDQTPSAAGGPRG
jgi:DNA-binding IclR family transcriptional regulator